MCYAFLHILKLLCNEILEAIVNDMRLKDNMPIPDFRSIILPLLKIASDQNEHRRRIVVDVLASHFPLTDEERRRVTEKRKQNVFDNRCDFALNFLRSNALLTSTGWGSFRITERGLAVIEALNEESEKIENLVLESTDRFLNYLNNRWPIEDEEDDDQTSGESIEDEEDDNQTSGESVEDEEDDDQAPEKSIEENYHKIREGLAAELLQQIKGNSPAFFEKLVVDLLVTMGYGGSWEDAGEVTGGPGDGGIDGIINQDKLGLDVVGVQAKLRTTENNVGPSIINEFVGALRLKGLSKGVIITTAGFSNNAQASAERSDNPKIVLIDGKQLAQLMIDHGVGVSTVETYEIKRVDSDYFAENAD